MDIKQVEAGPGSFHRYTLVDEAPSWADEVQPPLPTIIHLQGVAPPCPT
jgi:hypothetical protein